MVYGGFKTSKSFVDLFLEARGEKAGAASDRKVQRVLRISLAKNISISGSMENWSFKWIATKVVQSNEKTNFRCFSIVHDFGQNLQEWTKVNPVLAFGGPISILMGHFLVPDYNATQTKSGGTSPALLSARKNLPQNLHKFYVKDGKDPKLEVIFQNISLKVPGSGPNGFLMILDCFYDPGGVLSPPISFYFEEISNFDQKIGSASIFSGATPILVQRIFRMASQNDARCVGGTFQTYLREVVNPYSILLRFLKWPDSIFGFSLSPFETLFYCKHMWLCLDTNIEEIFIFRAHFFVCFDFAGVCEETVGCFWH